MTTTSRKKKNSYHHGNLRSDLVKEAIQLISKGGIENLTLREVSRLLGVSQTAPYRHFKDKTALLVAVAEEGFRVLQSEMAKAAGSRSSLAKLRAMGVAYVQFATDHAPSFRVMFGGAINLKEHASLKEAAHATLSLLETVILECQKEGSMSAKSPKELALVCWSVVHGLSNLTINGQLKDSVWEDEKTVGKIVSVVLESLS